MVTFQDKISHFHDLTGLYITLSTSNGTLLISFGSCPLPDTFTQSCYEPLQTDKAEFNYMVSSEGFAYAKLRSKEYNIFIGTAYTGEDLSLLSETLHHICDAPLGDCQHEASSIPTMNLSNFINSLIFLNNVTNCVKNAFPYSVVLNDNAFSEVHEQLQLTFSIPNSNDFEKNLLTCIKNGDEQNLAIIFQHMLKNARFPIFKTNTIRSMKNVAIVSLTEASRTAIAVGMDYARAINTTTIYLDQIELLNDYTALSNLIFDIMLFYTREVHAILAPPADSLLVKKACLYVHNHATEDISPSDVAAACKVSSTYLSHRFHEEIGMTLVHFIQKEKIDLAKHLLKETDLSPSEIAQELSFSSQQYFQTIFKKITQVTPRQYREQEG